MDVEGRVCKGVGASLRPEAEGLREKSHLANDAVKNANTARTPGQGTVLPFSLSPLESSSLLPRLSKHFCLLLFTFFSSSSFWVVLVLFDQWRRVKRVGWRREVHLSRAVHRGV